MQKATVYLSNELHHEIKLDAIDIDWFDKIKLKHLSVEDKYLNQMIYVDEAIIDFDIGSLRDFNFRIQDIVLRDGKVKVVRFRPDGEINITEFIESIREMGSPRSDSSSSSPFIVDNVRLENMQFTYFDQRKILDKVGFDHNHFHIDSIYSDIKDFKIHADTFYLGVQNLRGFERQSGLRIHNFTSDYLITKSKMEFDKLDATIGKSHLKEYLLFEYDNINDLADFNEMIDVTAKVNESTISIDDLSNFVPVLSGYKDKINISGDFKGKVERFGVRNLYASFGKSSYIQGRADFNGLPDIDETFIEFKFSQSSIAATDLRQYTTNKQTYKLFQKFGNLSGNGEFVGFTSDFVAKGDFKTNLGRFVPDINLKLPSEVNKTPTYSGKLETYALNLGEITENNMLGLIDMNGSIKGKGFTLEDAEMNLKARISRVGINKYDFKNITTNATLSNRLFNGEISVKDSNLIFSANGKVDLRENKNIFDIVANFERANLKPLGLSTVETLVKTDLELNFTGIEPDDIVGSAKFKNTYLLYKDNKEIFIDYLFAQSLKNETERSLNILSDLITVDAKGNFEFSQLLSDAEILYKEYLLDLKNDQNAIAEYYAKKNVENLNKYNLDFNLHVKNVNSILSIYVPGLYLSKNLRINGSFSSGYTSILDLHTEIDTLHYQENELYNAYFDISTSKIADSSQVLGMFYLNSAKQVFKNVPSTRDLQLEGIWNNRNIKFFSRIFQVGSSNDILLNGNLSFEKNNSINLTTKNSFVNILNKTWKIADTTEIVFRNNNVTFTNFNISNGNQQITLNGTLSENDKTQSAHLSVNNFQLQTFNPLIKDLKLQGIMDGNVVLNDIYNNLNIDGNTLIKGLTIDNIHLGNISGNSSYDNLSQKLSLDIDVERLEQTVLNLKGYIETGGELKDNEVNLTASLNNTDLNILNSLLKEYVSDITGKVTGTFKITGPLSAMHYNGRADVRNGKFKVNYLGTTYTFDDYIYFDENLIGFRNLKLKDVNNNISYLDGGLYHDNFNNFIVNLRTRLNSFQVFNLTENDNDLYYGIAYMTGTMEMLGTFANLEITAQARTNRGTRIFIPLNKSGALEKQEYISFRNKKTASELTEKEVDLSGIRLDFNLDITPEAYTEIIFDKRAGDIIRGNGEGNIRMDIDTRGDFHLYGNYKIIKGAYNFTLAGLINKEFTIHPGSAINWSGDPYGGNLDIKASYDQFVTLRPIILDTNLAVSEGSRRYPVKTILNVSGYLLAPDINLDIKISGFPNSLAQTVTEFESEIQSNDNELSRQVFSLLFLNNFAPKTTLTHSRNPGGNLSEMLSHQLSSWLSQVDDNLQIDLNLNQMDLEALNTFRLRLTYTLLDGRLRISRDGNVNSQQTQNDNSMNALTNIAGEWTVEYLLSDDGKFRLKLYNRNNTNQLLTSLTNNNNTTAGFSIMHTQNFDNLKELFTSKKKKKEVTKESQEEFLKKLDEIQEHLQYRQEKIQNKEKEKEESEKEKSEETEDEILPDINLTKPKEDDESKDAG
ncbi:MAG: translocation/assembly module TamB domain-containing protein [Cytophagaceae bacterium]